MALLDEIKKRMFAAMKAQKTVEKEILRVAVGEITTAAARVAGGELSDEDIQGVLKKLLKSNREALAVTEDSAQKAALEEEIVVIEALLPQRLDVDQIVAALSNVSAAIQAAPNQGPAMGIAMKALKAAGAEVDSKDVTAAVGKIRG